MTIQTIFDVTKSEVFSDVSSRLRGRINLHVWLTLSIIGEMVLHETHVKIIWLSSKETYVELRSSWNLEEGMKSMNLTFLKERGDRLPEVATEF